MTITELMAAYTPDEEYTGLMSVDDYAVAINTTPGTPETADNDYCILQKGITGQPMSFNPEETTRKFIRGGKQTSVTDKQLTISISGVRYCGDAAQDFIMGEDMKFATGQDVVTDFIYFNVKTGKGYKGKCAIVLSSENEGNAGDDATFSCDLKSTEVKPSKWTYSPGV